jgi:hypothetical protein
MGKPNYAFAKRQRDLAKKKKKEEKRKKKAEAQAAADLDNQPETTEEGSEGSSAEPDEETKTD